MDSLEEIRARTHARTHACTDKQTRTRARMLHTALVVLHASALCQSLVSMPPDQRGSFTFAFSFLWCDPFDSPKLRAPPPKIKSKTFLIFCFPCDLCHPPSHALPQRGGDRHLGDAPLLRKKRGRTGAQGACMWTPAVHCGSIFS